jgi:hypothetical protein
VRSSLLRSRSFLRRRPESPQGYVALRVLWRLADAEMGIDLRDRRLSDVDRRSAFPVVVHWVRELTRSTSPTPVVLQSSKAYRSRKPGRGAWRWEAAPCVPTPKRKSAEKTGSP